jgi:hypothetical protein
MYESNTSEARCMPTKTTDMPPRNRWRSSIQLGLGRLPRNLLDRASPQKIPMAITTHATTPLPRATYHQI